MPYNNFKDVLIKRLDGGLNTHDDPSKINANYSPDLQNINFTTGGSFQLRQGTKVFGSQVSSLSGIKSLHNYKRSDGIEIPMRTWSTDVEYYNRQTSAWSLLSSGYTSNVKFDFADYDGYTYFCNSYDSMFRWSGNYATTSASHAASATVIEMNEDLTSWSSACVAIIGTQPVYYGSRTSGTLSALTGISAAIGADYEATEAATSSRGFASVSSIPKGNILLLDTDRLFVAGVSSDWPTMYYSKIGDPTDFTYNSPRVDDDGGTVTIGDGGGEITGLASRERGDVLIYKKHAVKAFKFIPLDSTTTDFPSVTNVVNSTNAGSESDRGITNVESNVYYMAPRGGVRGIVTNQVEGLDTVIVSENITPTIDSLANVSTASIYQDRKVYFETKESDSNVNNITLVLDTEANEGKGSWTKYKGWSATDFMEFDGSLYFGAANEKTVYKANVGYTDDGVAYTSYWKSKLINLGLPHVLKRVRYIYVEGYISQAGVLSAGMFINGFTSNSKNKVIYGNGSYVDPTDNITFGDATFGGTVFGGTPGTADVNLSRFKLRLSYNLNNLFNFQFQIKSNKEGTVYRIDQIVPYVEQMDGVVFPVSNII